MIWPRSIVYAYDDVYYLVYSITLLLLRLMCSVFVCVCPAQIHVCMHYREEREQVVAAGGACKSSIATQIFIHR